MYRIKRKFAFTPQQVYIKTGTDTGEWDLIFFRYYYIVQELKGNGQWIFKTGDYKRE